jgi:hypothetical protein
METNKIYSLDGNPAVIIDYKEGEPNATALCLTRAEILCTVHMVNTPITAFKSYKCPYAEEKDPARIYCKDGECQYLIPKIAPTVALNCMCFSCMLESLEAEDEANN